MPAAKAVSVVVIIILVTLVMGFRSTAGVPHSSPWPECSRSAAWPDVDCCDCRIARKSVDGPGSFALKVMEVLSLRLERAESIIEDINLHSAERRLAQSLLRLSHGEPELELAVTKGELASQLGMTQETLSRKLSLFQDRGLISQKGQRRILILDREGLAEIR